MALRVVLTAGVTLVLPHMPTVFGSGCRLEGQACVCATDTGQEWDLSALGRGEFVMRGPSTGCAICVGDWVYSFDLCRNVAVPQALGCNPTMQTAMVRLDEYSIPTSRECQLMGPDVSSGQLLVSSLSGNSEGLELTYSYLARTVRLSLICDTSAAGSVPDRIEMGGDAIQAVWRTPAGCSGGFVGWLIIIFFLSGICVYLLCGIGWAKFNDSKVPIAEAHPHTGYWRMLPALVSDGVTYTRAKVSSGLAGRRSIENSSSEPIIDSPTSLVPRKEKKGKKKNEKKKHKRTSSNMPKPRPVMDEHDAHGLATVSQRALDIDSKMGVVSRE